MIGFPSQRDIHRLIGSWCTRFVSCDRGVNSYEVDLSDISLRGFSAPIPMFIAYRWDSDARTSLLEKTNRIAENERIMIVGAGSQQAELHAWKELPPNAVYLHYNELRTIAVDEDPIAIIQSAVVSQIGIRHLNPIDSPVDRTALIKRESDIHEFREIDAPIVTISGLPLLGKSIFIRQALSDDEAVFIDCKEYEWDSENEIDFSRFLGQNLRSPAIVHSVEEFTTALIDEFPAVHPTLVLDNSHAWNVYRSPVLSLLAKAAALKPLRIVFVGQSNVFLESKWLRPNCKTERFVLPSFSDDQSYQFVHQLFRSLEIRLVDADRVMAELATMANGLPGQLSLLCNRLIKACVFNGRHTIGHLDVYRLKLAPNEFDFDPDFAPNR